MPKVPLTAETLDALSDGLAGRVINAALSKINSDLLDRGEDGKTRTLTVTYQIKLSGADSYEVNATAEPKCPAYRIPKTIAKLDAAAGGLVFHTDSSGNPNQMTLNDIVDDE